jgi:hypothetical protein
LIASVVVVGVGVMRRGVRFEAGSDSREVWFWERNIPREVGVKIRIQWVRVVVPKIVVHLSRGQLGRLSKC